MDRTQLPTLKPFPPHSYGGRFVARLVNPFFGFTITTSGVAVGAAVWGTTIAPQNGERGLVVLRLLGEGLFWGTLAGVMVGLFIGLRNTPRQLAPPGIDSSSFLSIAFYRFSTLHFATKIMIVCSSALIIWANLQTTPWAEIMNLRLVPPANLDPLTKVFFFKGWPYSPCLFCMMHGFRWHPEESFVQLALLLDWYVALLIIFNSAYLCEWWIRRSSKD
jgi:hypothetical protein